MSTSEQLTRRQRQIMDVLFREGEATVSVIRDAMPDPPSHTAVRTFLKILEDKGHLIRRRQGRANVFRPKAARSRAGRSALQRVIETFYEGSFEKAVTAHLAGGGDDLSDEELKRLMQLIREARSGGRGNK